MSKQIDKSKLRRKKPLNPDQVFGKGVGKRNVLESTIKKKTREAVKKRMTTRGGKYKSNPSKYPQLNEWRCKKNANRWNTLDWAGYWICSWFNLYDQEDPDFVGVGLQKTIKYKERFYHDIWRLGMDIEKLRDSNRGFRGDGCGTHEYLKWLFEVYLPGADWMTNPISSGQALRVTKNHFLRQFKTKDTKVKDSKKENKGTGKWNPWGYSRD